MLKTLIFICLFFCVTYTANSEEQVEILQNAAEIMPDGSFRYKYETGDGTRAMQEGSLKTVAEDRTGEVVNGEFSYTGSDGETYSVQYTADENGFQPSGKHIPTPHPIPELIQRSLQYLAESEKNQK